MDALKEAEREASNGNLWRAKEILHRSIKYSAYDVQLFEQLGRVLLQMQDLAEAGKYLFLSGVRKPEYEEAIDVFLGKYKGKPQNIFHPFPRSAKLQRVSEYPNQVAEKLREMGFTDELANVHGISLPPPTSWRDKIALVGCVFVLIVLLALFILGIVKLAEIVF